MTALRRYLAAFATLGLAAFEVATAWFASLLEVQLLSVGFALALVGLAAGLVGRRHGARLIAMGGAIAGATQMAIFALSVAGLGSLWWPFWVFAGLCTAVTLALAGPAMAEDFRVHLAPGSIWRHGGASVQVLAGGVVACAAAVPMLLIYAHVASMGHAWTETGLALAGALGLALAGGLVLSERTAGLLLLVPFVSVAGVVAVDATAWVFQVGYGLQGPRMVLASLLPALGLGIVLPMAGLVAFAKPLRRFWQTH